MPVMYDRSYSAQFKKDVRLSVKHGKDQSELMMVIETLAEGKPLPMKYYDHALKGEYKGCRECHVEPDWLLVYRIDKAKGVLALYRVSSHSELFG
jgi:mRNA interferase YafQ